MTTPTEMEKLRQTISGDYAICLKEVLTLEEAARYMGVSKSYLYKLTATRAIPHFKPTGKLCFFNRKELEDWLQSNPIATDADLNSRAQTYCMRNGAI